MVAHGLWCVSLNGTMVSTMVKFSPGEDCSNLDSHPVMDHGSSEVFGGPSLWMHGPHYKHKLELNKTIQRPTPGDHCDIWDLYTVHSKLMERYNLRRKVVESV